MKNRSIKVPITICSGNGCTYESLYNVKLEIKIRVEIKMNSNNLDF